MNTNTGNYNFWSIDRDVLRGRDFEFPQKLSPADATFVSRPPFLASQERRLLRQIQGRTYANMIGLFARFAGLGQEHPHLFCRIEESIAEGLPPGYRFFPQRGDVAEFVLAHSAWAVLALGCHIESLAEVHCRQRTASDARLSRLYRDVYFSLSKESTNARLCGRGWLREDAHVDANARDKAVNDFIILLQGIDALLLFQADWDVDYFAAICPRTIAAGDIGRLREQVLSIYRWQYIASGLSNRPFADLLGTMINANQAARIDADLAPMLARSPIGLAA